MLSPDKTHEYIYRFARIDLHRYIHRLTTGMALLTLLFANGCTITQENTQHDNSPQKYWPKPPTQARFIHEATLRYAEDIQIDDYKKKTRELLTGEKKRTPAFYKPHDIAARYGRLYITDLETRSVQVFDVPRRKFYRIGYRQEGKLNKPTGIALDGKSNVYVMDSDARRIVIYDFLGMFLRAIEGRIEMKNPVSVAVNLEGTRIYVVDKGLMQSKEHRIIAYDDQGNHLFTIGQRGKGEGEFNFPTDAVVAKNGNLYVMDAGNFRVQVFNSDGKFLYQWGELGGGFGQFARPRAIALDANDNVYITDAFFCNVQIFDSMGHLLLPIGQLASQDRPGNFKLIAGIAIDETSRLYVLDQFFNKLDVFRYLTEAEGKQIAVQQKSARAAGEQNL